MENEIRIVLLVIGVLVILGIFWDGLRRQHRQRSALAKSKAQYDHLKSQDVLKTALAIEDPMPLVEQDVPLVKEPPPRVKIKDIPREEPVIQSQAAVLEEPEVEEVTVEEIPQACEEVEIQASESPFVEEAVDDEKPILVAAHAPVEEAEKSEPISEREPVSIPIPSESVKEVSHRTSSATPAIEKPKPIPPEIIMFTLVARGEKLLGGFNLLQAILNEDFRFGEDRLFHIHEDNNPTQRILFSLAAATQSGQFDLSNMASFRCKGLIIFMRPRALTNEAHSVYEMMVNTTEILAESLSADPYVYQNQPWEESRLKAIYSELVSS